MISRHWKIIISFLLVLILCLGYIITQQNQSNIIPLTNNDFSCRKLDQSGGFYEAKPNCSTKRTIAKKSTNVIFNKYGHFTQALETQESHNTKRLLLLGGSHLLGIGAPPYYVEQSLEKLWKEKRGESIEVINASVEGHTSTQHAISIRENIKRYSPDIIVLATSLDNKLFLDAILHKRVIHTKKFLFSQFKSSDQIYGKYLNQALSIIPNIKYSIKTFLRNKNYMNFSREIKTSQSPYLVIEKKVLHPNLTIFRFLKTIAKSFNAKFYLIIEGNYLTNRYAEQLTDKMMTNFLLNRYIIRSDRFNDQIMKYYEKNDIPFLRIKNLDQKKYLHEGTKYLNENGFQYYFEEMINEMIKLKAKND